MKIRYLLFGLGFFLLAQSMGFSQGTQATSDDLMDDPLKISRQTAAIYLGPVFGYNKAMHSAELATFDHAQPCPVFEDGSQSGFHVGFFYEQFVGGLGSQHSIVARVLYNTFPATFTQVGDNQVSKLGRKLPNGTIEYVDVPSSIMNENRVSYNCLSLDLMYKFRVLDITNVGGLVLTVGPTFDYVMKKSNTQEVYILTPDNVQFASTDEELTQRGKGWRYADDSHRKIIVFDGDIPDAKSMRFGLKAGVQLEVKIPGAFDIIPGAFYNLGFTDVSNQDWKLSAFQISCDIRFAVSYLTK